MQCACVVFSDSKNSHTNAPQPYVIRKFPVLFVFFMRFIFLILNQTSLQGPPNTKDVRKVKIYHVRPIGNFLCLLWQHCRWPWSFICEPCSFDSGRNGFVWVRRVRNGSADPKSHQMRGAFHHTISQRKRWTSSGNSQTNCCCLWQCYESTKCDEERNNSLGKSSTTVMRCKKKSWRGSKGKRQTSMTRG